MDVTKIRLLQKQKRNMRKKVYLFACTEKNIGDDLFVYSVCKRYPNIDFVISAEAEYLKKNSIFNLEYNEKLEKWLKYANYEGKNLAKRVLVAAVERYYRLKLPKLDSIYIVGNAFKNVDYKGRYQIQWLKRRLSLSKSFCLISTNYGPANSDDWMEDCKEVFKEMDDVCFRDAYSYNLFRDLGNVRYAPDAVITLKKKIHEFSRNSSSPRKKKYIIVSVIDCLMEGRSKNLENVAHEYENKMVTLIDHFNKDGVDVILLNSNAEQDGPASKRIYEKCAHKDRVSVFNYDGDLQRIFDIFGSVKAVIATRLHTIILAWLNEVPVVPIVYDRKVEEILKSYSFDGFEKDITVLEGLEYDLLKTAIDEYSFELSADIVSNAEHQFDVADELLMKGENKIEE